KGAAPPPGSTPPNQLPRSRPRKRSSRPQPAPDRDRPAARNQLLRETPCAGWFLVRAEGSRQDECATDCSATRSRAPARKPFIAPAMSEPVEHIGIRTPRRTYSAEDSGVEASTATVFPASTRRCTVSLTVST